jgi:hypothetical protein
LTFGSGASDNGAITLHVLSVPGSLDLLIAEAKERARRRRFAALAVIVVAAGLATGLALMLRSPDLPGARVVRSAGIHVRLPRGWYVTRHPLNDVSWPVQRFVISSFPVTYDASKTGSAYLPPQAGVLAQIVEEYPPLRGEHWQPRPARLQLGRLGRMKLFAGDRWSELLFRHFYVFAWIGRNAPSSEREQLVSILDTMRVRKQ